MKALFFFFFSFLCCSNAFGSSHEIRVEPWMRPRVNFWIRIFTEISTNQGLIHDSRKPEIVWEKIDLNGLPRSKWGPFISSRVAYWSGVGMGAAKKEGNPLKMTDDEKRIFQRYASNYNKRDLENLSRPGAIRFQQGMKEEFEKAVKRGWSYQKQIQEILKKEELPLVLGKLPLVESGFNPKAVSKTGAVGMWQFMPETAKKYLKVNNRVDERKDPIKSTLAAAKLLKHNYRVFKSWPLAITAYNHGRKSLERIVGAVGSKSVKDIVERYRNRSFKFASGNFYISFLAAVEAEMKVSETHLGRREKK